MVRLALGYIDVDGKTWFIHRAATFGNMMRTDDPHQGRAFSEVFELQDWVESLPDHAKTQIAGRDLLILPIDFRVGDPTHRLRLDLDGPALEGSDGGHQAAVTLSPIKLQTISA